MSRLAAAIGAVMVALVMLLSATVALLGGDGDLSPSERAIGEIPSELLPLYRAAAQTCEGLEWTVLAAVHKTETSFGRGAVTSSAGAEGPMQFMPATFAAYGVDGNGDGMAEINELEDAVFSAAHYLCANGAGNPTRLRSALWNYNHDSDYVDEVATLAASYGVTQLPAGAALAQASSNAILDNPNIVLTELARQDIAAGIVDQRVLEVLDILSRRFTSRSACSRVGTVPT